MPDYFPYMWILKYKIYEQAEQKQNHREKRLMVV